MAKKGSTHLSSLCVHSLPSHPINTRSSDLSVCSKLKERKTFTKAHWVFIY